MTTLTTCLQWKKNIFPPINNKLILSFYPNTYSKEHHNSIIKLCSNTSPEITRLALLNLKNDIAMAGYHTIESFYGYVYMPDCFRTILAEVVPKALTVKKGELFEANIFPSLKGCFGRTKFIVVENDTLMPNPKGGSAIFSVKTTKLGKNIIEGEIAIKAYYGSDVTRKFTQEFTVIP